jgi:hypothetical protein
LEVEVVIRRAFRLVDRHVGVSLRDLRSAKSIRSASVNLRRGRGGLARPHHVSMLAFACSGIAPVRLGKKPNP